MKQLIRELMTDGYLKTPRIIDAFQKIDRRDFVPDEYKEQAYANMPLPIGYGQTISQPLTVAFMLELLQPKPGNKVLDIGSGSGYQTALLSEIVSDSGKNPDGKVFAIELVPELERFGRKNVSKYNFVKRKIAEFLCLNAKEGLPEQAPFDRIVTAASAQTLPEAWKKQLKPGGRMVAPIQNTIHLFVKDEKGDFYEEEHPGFAFVPFVPE